MKIDRSTFAETHDRQYLNLFPCISDMSDDMSDDWSIIIIFNYLFCLPVQSAMKSHKYFSHMCLFMFFDGACFFFTAVSAYVNTNIILGRLVVASNFRYQNCILLLVFFT